MAEPSGIILAKDRVPRVFPKKEIPILMQTEMVKSVLEDRKTVTRRMRGLDAINEFPDKVDFVGRFNDRPDGLLRFIFSDERMTDEEFGIVEDKYNHPSFTIKSPFGQRGDLLWVRENFAIEYVSVPSSFGAYPGFNAVIFQTDRTENSGQKWKPSIHMKKKDARLWLQIVDVTVERLQDITEEDSLKEGIIDSKPFGFRFDGICQFHTARNAFQGLWEMIHSKESWDKNPWVWAISFKVISKTGKP